MDIQTYLLGLLEYVGVSFMNVIHKYASRYIHKLRVCEG